MKIPFTKMHGLGNNYIYIDTFLFPLPEEMLSQLAIDISAVDTGIGSDGLILIGPSSVADVQMRIFNKDGSEGKNCGNGIRCVAKYAYESGLVPSKSMTIETKGGIVKANIVSHDGLTALVSVNMGVPKLSRREIPMKGSDSPTVVSEPFAIQGQTLLLTAVSMGNPHAVFFMPSLALAPHLTLGPLIERDSRFPERVNVEFITIKSEREIDFCVWERGSGATKACGTGACAAVVAAILNGHCKRGSQITVHLEGGDLVIEWSAEGDLYMQGPATTVAIGTYLN